MLNQQGVFQIVNIIEIIITCVYIIRCNIKETGTENAEDETV